MSEVTIPGNYGFEVEAKFKAQYPDYVPAEYPTFSVWLPHSCDEWIIAGPPRYDYGRCSREEAIEELQQFIAEAQMALSVLQKIEPDPAS